MDENLPEFAAGHLAGVELHPLRGQPLFHAVKPAAGEGDVVDNAGIRLLWLGSRRNIDEVHHRLTLAVHPGAGEGEIRPGAFFQAQHVLVEADGLGQIPGPDVEMIEHAHAYAAHAFAPLFAVLRSATLAQAGAKRTRCPPASRVYGAADLPQ